MIGVQPTGFEVWYVGSALLIGMRDIPDKFQYSAMPSPIYHEILLMNLLLDHIVAFLNEAATKFIARV